MKVANTEKLLVVVHRVFSSSEDEQVTVLGQAAGEVVDAAEIHVVELDHAPLQRSHVEHVCVPDKLVHHDRYSRPCLSLLVQDFHESASNVHLWFSLGLQLLPFASIRLRTHLPGETLTQDIKRLFVGWCHSGI